jgi:hypothetical protein
MSRSCLVTIATALVLSGACIDVAAPQEGPSLVIDSRLAPDLLKSILPIEFKLSDGSKMAIVGLRHCPSSASGDLFTAVIVPAGQTQSRDTLGSGDCTASLTNLARSAVRPLQAGERAAAARLEATWAPWELKLRVKQVRAQRKEGDGEAPDGTLTSKLQSTDPLAVLNTGNLQLSDRLARKRLNVAVYPQNTGIALVGTETAVAPNNGIATDLKSRLRAGPPHTTLLLRVPYEFLNSWVAAETADGQRVQFGGTPIVVRQLTVSGASDRLALSFLADYQPPQSHMRVQVVWSGPELRVSDVAVEAIETDCAGKAGAQLAACVAQNNFAKGIATTVRTHLRTKYGNTRLHPARKDSEVKFTVQGRQVTLDAETLRSTATASALELHMLAWTEGS